eukprot:13897447-Ditylum_brightwellii.AAC.1
MSVGGARFFDVREPFKDEEGVHLTLLSFWELVQLRDKGKEKWQKQSLQNSAVSSFQCAFLSIAILAVSITIQDGDGNYKRTLCDGDNLCSA